MSATHLVTVTTPKQKVDLALPGDVPMRDLIPEIVTACVDATGRNPDARWAIAPAGGRPFHPDATLDQLDILDGAILNLRDMGKPVPPELVNANATLSGKAKSGYHDHHAEHLQKYAKRQTHNRLDLDPSASIAATFGAADILIAIWVLINLGSAASAFIGLLAACVVVAVYIAAIWWMGWAQWFAEVTHLKFFENLPTPPGLS